MFHFPAIQLIRHVFYFLLSADPPGVRFINMFALFTQLYFYYHGRSGLTTWEAPTPPEPPNLRELIKDKDRRQVKLPYRREEPPDGMHRRERRRDRPHPRKKHLAPLKNNNAPPRRNRQYQEAIYEDDDGCPRKV